jgi:NADPH:quinone reductase-like Zn-dependent oxidoreductase
MRAQLITEYGTPDVFTLTEVDAPVAGPGEVLVNVAYAAMNPLEWKIRSGALATMIETPFPAILGNELSGVVDQVGAGVDRFAVGDRVTGFVPFGAYAEQVVTTADRLAPVPAGLSLERAATLPTAAETAQRALALIAVRPGETVVVNAAAGSVGSAVVQLLVAGGATVIGTASAANHNYLRSLGATPVRHGEHLLDDLRVAAPDGIDAAFDGGAHGFVAQILTLMPADRVVTIVDFEAGAAGVHVAAGDPLALTAASIGPVLQLAAEGRFHTEIDAVMPLAELADAHRRSETGHVRGKLLVHVADIDTALQS